MLPVHSGLALVVFLFVGQAAGLRQTSSFPYLHTARPSAHQRREAVVQLVQEKEPPHSASSSSEGVGQHSTDAEVVKLEEMVKTEQAMQAELLQALQQKKAAEESESEVKQVSVQPSVGSSGDDTAPSFLHKPGGKKGGGGGSKKKSSKKGKVDEEEEKADEDKEPTVTRDAVKAIKQNEILRIILLIAFAIVFLCFFGLWIYRLIMCYIAYKKIINDSPKDESKAKTVDTSEEVTFKLYLQYRFAYWFAWTEGSTSILLSIMLISTLLVGAAFYELVLHPGMARSVWKTFVWLVAPDAGAGEATWTGAFIGAFMSIVGLIVFALLVTLFQDTFSAYIEALREGTLPVVESGHILLIGMGDENLLVVQELCLAYADTGGAVIVILSDGCSKVEMEQKLNDSGLDTMGSRVVVRGGQPFNVPSLKHVAADKAGTIVVMSDAKTSLELRDANVLQVLVSLRAEGWPLKGRIVTVCSLLRNQPLFEQIGGNITKVILLDRWLAKLMAQSSKQWGIGTIVNKTFGFSDSEFYIRPLPENLVGRPFQEASLFYDKGVPIGLMGKNQKATGKLANRRRTSLLNEVCNLCPGREYVFQDGDEIVLLAEDESCATPSETPFTAPAEFIHETVAHIPEKPKQVETVFILGWNEMIGLLTLEIDALVGKGSTLVIMATKDVEERENFFHKVQHRWQQKLQNITEIKHVEGQLGSRFQLEEMDPPIDTAARIFVLADEEADSMTHADACTVVTILQIRDIVVKKGKGNIPVIPEIRDHLTERMCGAVKASDFIDSSGLPSQVIAMVTFEPRIANILFEIISEEGVVHFAIKSIKEYLSKGEEAPTSLSFLQATGIVMRSGDICVGWSLPFEESTESQFQDDASQRGEFHRSMNNVCKVANPGSTLLEWAMNPADKNTPRDWLDGDRIVVLTTG